MDIQDDVGQSAGSGFGRLDQVAAATLALELVEEFNSASTCEALVQLILTHAATETRSDRAVLSWIDGNEMIVAGCVDPFGELVEVGTRWPLAGDQVSAVALAAGRAEAGPFEYGDLPGISSGLRATYANLRHLLVVPVLAGGEEIAILCVSRRRSERFTAEDSDVLDLIAAVGAQPLRAARLDDLLGHAKAEASQRLASDESVERIKSDILRLASHELRSPLTVLHGYLALVRAGHFGPIPEPLEKVVAILDRRTEEMKSLVNDMLVATRVDDIPAVAGSEDVDLRAILREATESIAPRASPQHSMTLELPEQAVHARVDSERLVLALRNIIDNAVKYSPQGGDVVCTLTTRDGFASIRVADEGLGIAPEDREKLFTRFGRVVTAANSHIPGIGLGLYFTREVARGHGGDVTLLEGAGPGCAFEMTLPLQGPGGA